MNLETCENGQALTLRTPTQPVITCARIARMHNLGNYEHIRYEVTVEIPEDHHAGQVIEHVAKLLDNLEPKPPVSDYDLLRAREALARPESEWDEWDLKNKTAYESYLARHAKWQAQREAAHAALGNLAVESTYTDAKETWDH